MLPWWWALGPVRALLSALGPVQALLWGRAPVSALGPGPAVLGTGARLGVNVGMGSVVEAGGLVGVSARVGVGTATVAVAVGGGAVSVSCWFVRPGAARPASLARDGPNGGSPCQYAMLPRAAMTMMTATASLGRSPIRSFRCAGGSFLSSQQCCFPIFGRGASIRHEGRSSVFSSLLGASAV